MPFSNRNPYYLRISENIVLPIYVYLDDGHLDWMSDRILQHVLADLRPHILPKLRAEANANLGSGGIPSAKKFTVDAHRGDTYQFCYFIRKTEPHSVLIKTRTFIARPPREPMGPPPVPAPSSRAQKGKRKGRATTESTKKGPSPRKKRKTKGKGKARTNDDDEMTTTSEEDDDPITSEQLFGAPRRRSARNVKVVAGGYVVAPQTSDPDVEMAEPDLVTPARDSERPMEHIETPTDADLPDIDVTVVKDETADISLIPSTGITDVDATTNIAHPPAIEIDLEVEEEEPKPKPVLQLKYQGFRIYGHCLCIVVEPWPPMRRASRAPSAFPPERLSRAPSIAPADFVTSADASALRGRTPLFLPDDDDRDRSETPAPFLGRRVLPPVPLFNASEEEDEEDDDDFGGMMELTQVLNAAGDFRAGAADDDDDDMDGAVFFGDADETREL